jgi:putative endonuclease
MSNKQITGRMGEQAAADYLIEKGYQIIDRNWRSPHGEIDLIVQQNHDRNDSSLIPGVTIVFVEVKTRRTRSYGPPEESVNYKKQSHLLAAIEYYIQHNPLPDVNWRIDVISVAQYAPNRDLEIVHFENAITT